MQLRCSWRMRMHTAIIDREQAFESKTEIELEVHVPKVDGQMSDSAPLHADLECRLFRRLFTRFPFDTSLFALISPSFPSAASSAPFPHLCGVSIVKMTYAA